MKIYTSYFAKTKELEELGIFPVSIAYKTPSFFKNPSFGGSCGPTASILYEYKKNPDKERYIRRYKDECLVIWKDPQILIDGLKYVSKGKDVALMCYEKHGDFCHRHLLADFLNEKLGLDIKEFEFKTESSVEVDELF